MHNDHGEANTFRYSTFLKLRVMQVRLHVDDVRELEEEVRDMPVQEQSDQGNV